MRGAVSWPPGGLCASFPDPGDCVCVCVCLSPGRPLLLLGLCVAAPFLHSSGRASPFPPSRALQITGATLALASPG